MHDADNPIMYAGTFVLWYVLSILIGVHIAYAQMFRVMRKEEHNEHLRLMAELEENSARLLKQLEEHDGPFNITLPDSRNDAPEATTKI